MPSIIQYLLSPWTQVIVKNLKTDAYETHLYDYVFVCNGHYNKGLIPDFPGRTNFTGRQIHSHVYRSAEAFKGKSKSQSNLRFQHLSVSIFDADENVLVIGGGPSGRDVVLGIASTSKNVFFSTHRNLSQNMFPANVKLVPDVKEFKESSVSLVDGNEYRIDSVIYCTGKYTCGTCFNYRLSYRERHSLQAINTRSHFWVLIVEYTFWKINLSTNYISIVWTSIGRRWHWSDCRAVHRPHWYSISKFGCASVFGTKKCRCHPRTIC